jgi:hypothetical protein
MKDRIPDCIEGGLPPCPTCPVVSQCEYGSHVVQKLPFGGWRGRTIRRVRKTRKKL